MKLIQPSKVYGHISIIKIAHTLANEVYEILAHDNNFYAQWPNKQDFIEVCAPTLIEEAKQIMAKMLGDPDLDERHKEKIFDALMKDHAVPRPKGVWQVN